MLTITDYPSGTTSTAYATDAVGANVNPITLDSNGQCTFYIVPGAYTYTFVKSGITTKVETNVIEGAASESFLQSGTGAVSRSVTDDLNDDFRVTRFMSAAAVADARAGTGAVSVSTAFQTAIDAAQAITSATNPIVITVPRGVYLLDGADLSITESNIIFNVQNARFKVAQSTATSNAFSFAGSTLSAPTLGSNAAIYATSVSLSVLGGVVAGGWLMFNKTTPSGGGAYRFISKVRSVSGVGPYTVVLATALPIAFATADTGLELRCISPLENVGIIGQCTFDATLSSATTQHCVKGLYLVNSRFSGIRGVSNDTGAVLWAPYGHGNTFDNCSGQASGTASFGALEYDGQTGSQITNQRVLNGSNFGVHLTSANYCTIANLIGEGSVLGRCVKFQSSLENSVTNIQGHAATAANGVAVSIGSCRNNFFGINSNGNATSEGLWLSDQDNCDNNFHGVTANGNATRDIHIGATDLRNHFFGGKATTIYIGASNATCFFYGMNGIPLMGGYSANAPVTLMTKTSGANTPAIPVPLDLSGAAAGQIAFPATQNASADANTLDDYEEGTWTPVLTFATPGDVAVTYTNQTGNYVKIGRMVHLFFNITTTAFTHTTAAGALQITGNPFTQANIGSVFGALSWQGITKAGYTQVSSRVNATVATVDFFASASAQSTSSVVSTDVPTGGTVHLRGSLTIFV